MRGYKDWCNCREDLTGDLPRILSSRLSEKPWRSLQRSSPGRLRGVFRPISPALHQPNLPPECCLYPVSDSLSKLYFSHLGAPQSASANGSMNALRLFSGRCARATRKKSLGPSKSAPASFSPHEEVERRRAQRAPRKVELQASESGPFRSTANLLAKRPEQGVGARSSGFISS